MFVPKVLNNSDHYMPWIRKTPVSAWRKPQAVFVVLQLIFSPKICNVTTMNPHSRTIVYIEDTSTSGVHID